MRASGIPCILLAIMLAFLCWPPGASSASAKDSVTFEEVVVKGTREKDVLEIKQSQTNTESTITRQGLDLYGGAGQINPYKALDILPSVNYQGTDPYGLSYNQRINVRGLTGLLSTVEGIQLNSGLTTPGVGDRWYFDMENISSISLYRGAVAPDKSLGAYNTAGTMDRTILRASDKVGFTVRQSVGSYGFSKTFARIDSGLLPSKTKFFASFSRTDSDKWKGLGDFKSEIFTFGVTQGLSPYVNVEVFGTHSTPETNVYRSLTYAQADRLSDFYRYDYNRTLTGNQATDVFYYDYNKVNFENTAFFGNIEIKPPSAGRFLLKPYYMRSKGSVFSGMGNILGSAGVREWVIDFNLYGIIGQYDINLGGTDFTLGYWYYTQEPPGPPTAYRVYRAKNGVLSYAGWSQLSKVTENYKIHSPWISAERKIGDFRLNGALRYMYETTPSIDLYTTTGIPDVNYRDAFDYARVDPMGSVNGTIIRELLPNFGINYAVTKELNTYFNYGRNFGRVSVESFSTYAGNRNAFANKGVTAQSIWNNATPEISDNFDLGARFNNNMFHVSGGLFYGIYNDKAVSVAEPISGVKYNQNIAKATSWGAELEASIDVTKSVNIFATASYNKFEFTNDIHPTPTTTRRAKGNQVPDVPVYQARLGGTYRFFDFAFSPMLRYVGRRYGDVENTQSIPSHTLVDADIRYSRDNVWIFKNLTAGLSLYNIFNTEYISVISTSDDTLAGAASYYAGSPFTVMGRLELKF